ncbi:IS630 family transposase [Gibbsiella quercinecans]|uniref:IS630 family transposase n=1 Tax=Gibbsiella quercinecans TaxID=929813 RepID=UPI000EF250A6|nr:IS630 family transposase [Gibbsiella quercinecans]RLM03610.1 IS630 family transposase [Gibbsiella quercinecans]
MPIIAPIPCDKRYLMIEALHTTDDKVHLRRLNAILLLEQGYKVSHVAKMLYCARSSVIRWINWLTVGGMEARLSLTPGRECRWSRERTCGLVSDLLDFSPGDFCYQRSRWSSEPFSIIINDMMNVFFHPGTFRRWLPQMDIVWRRAAPTLRIPDPNRAEKMAAIQEALDKCDDRNPVFYEDELDIDLNPKIGADWQLRGQQKKVVTPGINEKCYLAGALHSQTGEVIYAEGSNKKTALFISLLEKLNVAYSQAESVTLIIDNYYIHKSKQTEKWLTNNPKFKLVFQPVYSPWVNRVELLWLSLHETVTRTHQCRFMWQLLDKVRHFMKTVSPFPGAGHGKAKV